MSIYDQLLGVVQHGYDQANQNQMAVANMPTFADKFLAGLRGGEDAAYKRNLGMSQLAMNMGYKQAQQQQMAENAELHKAQLRNLVAKYISENLVGDNRPEIAEYAKSVGMPESMVPSLKFEHTPYTYDQEMAPAFEGGSISEGGETTSTPVEASTSTPIKYSDWGTDAAFKQKALDQRKELAELSLQQKMMIEQAKRERPQDPLGKLTESFLAGRISSQDFYAMKNKMLFIQDPAAGPAASSGYRINPNINTPGATPAQVLAAIGGGVNPTVPPAPSSSATIPNNLPGGPVAQTQKPPKAPNVPGSPLPAPGQPLPKKVEETGKEYQALQNFQSVLDRMNNQIDKIRGTTPEERYNYDFALGVRGLLAKHIPKTDTMGVINNINVLKSQLMVQAMESLKQASASGATGFGPLSEKEGEVLRTTIANLDPSMSKKDFDAALESVKAEIVRLRNLANNKMSGMAEVRNVPTSGGKYSGVSMPRAKYESLSPAAQKAFTDGGGYIK